MKSSIQILRAIVAPKKKKVKIMMGDTLLKEYNFKIDVPFKRVLKQFYGYDYGAFSVSERDYAYTKEVVEWDVETIKKIEQDALSFYNKTQNNNYP